MNRSSLVAFALLTLAACSPEFDPASRVEKLRLLAVQAEPPEIAPPPASGAPVAPDRAALTALVLRADFATDLGRKTTVAYLACVPVPGDPSPSPCVLLAGLGDPAGVLDEAAGAACAATAPGAAPPPIAFAGVEVCKAPAAGAWGTCGAATAAGGATLPSPELAIPTGYGTLFEALPPGAPERVLGVGAVVLAFAIDATPDELASGPGACLGEVFARRLAALWGRREHVLSAKRVSIRGPEAPDPPNLNPFIEGISAAGTLLDLAAPSSVARANVTLAPVLPAGADVLHQAYTELDASGVAVSSKTEEWVYSWFASAGDLKNLRTRDGSVEEPWDLTAAPAGRAIVAVVARDLRGGVAWTWRETEIAP